jgi:molybdenum cofactor guanylyltransferase
MAVATALAGAGATEILAVGGDGAAFASLGLRPIPDEHPGTGPLNGVISALAQASETTVVVAPCDLPALRAEDIECLVNGLTTGGATVAIAHADGRPNPAIAAYRAQALPVLRRAFGAGERALHAALADIDLRIEVELPPQVAIDLDSPDDLHRYHHGNRDPGTTRR